jgi:hypothetical protein
VTTYRLVRDQRPVAVPPALDRDQQAVVDHPGGPLLVLAGPGTGKTTTLVEAIAQRIEAGADPASVLALTFSRKAAEQLCDRVMARVGRTVSASMCSTFHSYGPARRADRRRGRASPAGRDTARHPRRLARGGCVPRVPPSPASAAAGRQAWRAKAGSAAAFASRARVRS